MIHFLTPMTFPLTVGVSWRLLSSVVPSVKGPDSTFFRLPFTSISRSSTSTLRRSASRHASSLCFKQASNEACRLGSEDDGQPSVTQTAGDLRWREQTYLGRRRAPLCSPSSPSSGSPDCSSPPPSLSPDSRAHRCSDARPPPCGSCPVSPRRHRDTLGING